MSKILRFVGPEVYVSGKGKYTVYTGQSVTVEDGMAESLLTRFPDWFEVVTEDGDVVLVEGNIELNEPFSDLTVEDDTDDPEDEKEDEETEEVVEEMVEEVVEEKTKRGRKAH